MSEHPRQLNQIQRWMQSVISHPDGVAEGIDSEQARAEIDISASHIEQIIQPSKTLSSLQRLEIYGHAYYARLLECVREEFPSLVHALGEDVFNGFAFGYLQSYPSQSYTLMDLGSKFSRYLEETRPALEDDDDIGIDWPAFLIDLARLERTYAEVFDGPGVEGVPLLKTEDLLAISPEQWSETRLVPVPCLELMSFQFSVHEYASAVRQGEDPAIPDAEPTWLAITRRDFVVRRIPYSRPQFELLNALKAGKPLGEAIEHAVTSTEADIDLFVANLKNWFHDFAAAGLFLRVDAPES